MAEEYQRELLRGSLDLIVLSALADGAKYGYLIQQRVGDASGGRVDLKAGTLYPLLHRLEAGRWIKSHWEDSTGRRRKWYELTAAGKRRLQAQADAWRHHVDCVSQLLLPVFATSPKPA